MNERCMRDSGWKVAMRAEDHPPVPALYATTDLIAPNTKRRASAHFPKFVLRLSIHLHELRKVMGTNKSMIPVPHFYLKLPNRIRRLRCRNFK